MSTATQALQRLRVHTPRNLMLPPISHFSSNVQASTDDTPASSGAEGGTSVPAYYQVLERYRYHGLPPGKRLELNLYKRDVSYTDELFQQDLEKLVRATASRGSSAGAPRAWQELGAMLDSAKTAASADEKGKNLVRALANCIVELDVCERACIECGTAIEGLCLAVDSSRYSRELLNAFNSRLERMNTEMARVVRMIAGPSSDQSWRDPDAPPPVSAQAQDFLVRMAEARAGLFGVAGRACVLSDLHQRATLSTDEAEAMRSTLLKFEDVQKRYETKAVKAGDSKALDSLREVTRRVDRMPPEELMQRTTDKWFKEAMKALPELMVPTRVLELEAPSFDAPTEPEPKPGGDEEVGPPPRDLGPAWARESHRR